MRETVVLTDGESIEVVVAKGKVKIDSDGVLKVDAETDGYSLPLFGSPENQQNAQFAANGRYEPNKAEKIGQYLCMLFEAQKVDHNVHAEIDEALKQYKSELAI